MPPLFSSISEVNPSKTQWSLRVRLVRCYQVPVFQKNTFSLECVFHDREGDRIHGSIKKDEVMQRLKPILREGHIFAIKNMVVAKNGMTFKTIKNKYKIIFIANTHVCEIFEDTFPNLMYEFKSFPALSTASDVVDDTTLFGKIGYLVLYGEILWIKSQPMWKMLHQFGAVYGNPAT
ncbi:uncharacterized protein [Primulina eburnea]|uniref:uncharacterized protein n=1 Tax=Primulina eburnea TaxID=1245227 RepID=UPI003C6C0D49